MNPSSWRVATVAVAAVILGESCSVLAPRPDPSRFFTLTPIADVATTPGKLSGRVLGIGPITFPDYLDRPELVTRVGPNEVRHSTSDYWAGSLAEQFESTLAQNLQALLSPSSIVRFPWYAATAPDVIVEIDVRQMERATDGQVHVIARWRVRTGGEVARAAESTLSRPAADDPGATAAALSELMGELSRQIAEAIAPPTRPVRP